MTDIDLSGFVSRFRDEARELLQRLTDGLLTLEKDPEDKEALAETKRAAHTLKGNAGFLELEEINKVAHAMEDLLDAIGEGKVQIAPEFFDLLFSARDMIGDLLAATASDQPTSVDWQDMVTKVRNLAADQKPPKAELAEERGQVAAARRAVARASETSSRKEPAQEKAQIKGKATLSDERLLEHFETVSAPLAERIANSLSSLQSPSGLKEIAQYAYRIKDTALLLEFDEAADLSEALATALETAAGKNELPTEEGRKIILHAAAALAQPSSPEPVDVDELTESLAALPTGKSSQPAPSKKVSSRSQKLAASSTVPARTERPKHLLREGISDTIRVNTPRVDALVNLAGEIVINEGKAEEQRTGLKEILSLVRQSEHAYSALRTKTLEIAHQRGAPLAPSGTGAALPEEDSVEASLERFDRIRGDLNDRIGKFQTRFEEVVSSLGVTAARLQEHATRMRMLPLSTVLDEVPRAIRDLARQFAKKIDCSISGRETLLDKKMLEGLSGPLVHVIRNAVDHGIESPEERLQAGKPEAGLVQINARQEGDRVLIEISDDGRGIEPEQLVQKALESGIIDSVEAQAMTPEAALYLIFQPGFTTRSVVSDVSGRGVGMDVVKKDVEDLKGEVTIRSQIGLGTTVSMRLPLTLAVIPTVLVESLGQKYAIPSASVKKVTNVDPGEIHSVEGREAVVCDGRTVPLVSMKDVLRLQGEPVVSEGRKLSVVVIAHAQEEIGFLVDGVLGEQQLVVKNLAGNLRQLTNVAGGAILGTGEVVIILHVPDLIASAKAAPARKVLEEVSRRIKPKERRGRVLVVEDSLTTRELQRSILEAAGYEADVAVDGLDGLRKVTDTEYDVVITDISMPRMDGFDMIQRIKRDPRRKSVPVIIITSRATESDKKRGMAVGADMFIVKTEFDQSSFLEAVSKFAG